VQDDHQDEQHQGDPREAPPRLLAAHSVHIGAAIENLELLHPPVVEVEPGLDLVVVTVTVTGSVTERQGLSLSLSLGRGGSRRRDCRPVAPNAESVRASRGNGRWTNHSAPA
jgi:hypothetical protein